MRWPENSLLTHMGVASMQKWLCSVTLFIRDPWDLGEEVDLSGILTYPNYVWWEIVWNLGWKILMLIYVLLGLLRQNWSQGLCLLPALAFWICAFLLEERWGLIRSSKTMAHISGCFSPSWNICDFLDHVSIFSSFYSIYYQERPHT